MSARRWVVACRVVWFVLAVSVYAFSVNRFYVTGDPDAEIFLIYGMLVLSFPVSWVIAAGATIVVSSLQSSTGEIVQTSFLGMTAFWIAQSIGGYVQWFVFVPWFRRREEKSKGEGQ